MDYEVESGVEIPEREWFKERKYPFGDLEKGQSFFVPLKDLKHAQQLRGAAAHFARRHGIKFTVRKRTEEGVEGLRCWRVE